MHLNHKILKVMLSTCCINAVAARKNAADWVSIEVESR